LLFGVTTGLSLEAGWASIEDGPQEAQTFLAKRPQPVQVNADMAGIQGTVRLGRSKCLTRAGVSDKLQKKSAGQMEYAHQAAGLLSGRQNNQSGWSQ
jgi:hypothetical protein